MKKNVTDILDIHTHKLEADSLGKSIVNYPLLADSPLYMPFAGDVEVDRGYYYSVGIHPWELTEHNAGQLLDYLKQQLRKKQFVAVGEAGLDKLAVASMELQLTVFKAQVRLSEEYGLPLIIHCVKAMDELLAVKKEFRPQQAWVWHGFRGKPEQAMQLLKKGFYLSFGEYYPDETMQNYNHPSIVVWGLSNEISMGGATPAIVQNHKMLNDLVHSIDKTRPTTEAVLTACNINEEYVHISDVLSYNHYFGWYGGDVSMYGNWFDNFHKKYPNKAIGMSEYGCEALNWHTSNPEQGDYTEEYQAYYHEEVIKQIAKRPYMWATHVWNMFDFAADARAEGGENGMNHKGLVTFDRKYKKDSFYAYQAWLSKKPMLHICGKRYVDRVEDVTKITVYTNLDEVELFANGESVGKQKKGEFPFFYFEVKNKGETTLVAKAGELTDESKIKKVDKFNEDYRLKEEGAVINWFEIETPAGYYSVNDTLGDILSTFRGKICAVKLLMKMKKALTPKAPKEKGKKKQGAEIMGFKLNDINKTMIDMLKGFTVKRGLMMLGGKFTKEQILEINAMLNKVKKK